MFAGEVRRKRVSRMREFQPSRWHLDETYVKLNGKMVYLWRVVDPAGEIPELCHEPVTSRRHLPSSKYHGSPEVITTDGLRSYSAAINELGSSDKQEIGRWANNRVENSHLPFRRLKRAMLRIRLMNTLISPPLSTPTSTSTSV